MMMPVPPASANTSFVRSCTTYAETLGYQADVYEESNFYNGSPGYYSSYSRTTGTTSGYSNNQCWFSTMNVEASLIMKRLDQNYVSLGLCNIAYTSDTDGWVDVNTWCSDTWSTWHMETTYGHRAWWWGNNYDYTGQSIIEFY